MISPGRKQFIFYLVVLYTIYSIGYFLLWLIIPSKVDLTDLYSFQSFLNIILLTIVLHYTSEADSSDPDSYKKHQDRTLGTSVTLDRLYKEIEKPWTANLGYTFTKTDSEIAIDTKLDTMSITSEEKGILRIKSKQKRMFPLSDSGRNFKDYERIKSILIGIENS